MAEHIAQCRWDADERIEATHNGVSVILNGYCDGEHVTNPFLRPDVARTFARGVLALADEIDGGEAKAEPTPVKVGDRVRIVRATYADETHGREGVVTSTSETWRATNGDPHPYVVRLNDGDTVHVAELKPADEPADEPTTPVNPRADYVTQAQALLADDYNHTVADVLALARFLAGE